MNVEETLRLQDEVKHMLLLSRVPSSYSRDTVCREDPTLLSVGGVLFIHPPYTPCSCQSTNEIILSRIQWLLKKDSNVSSDTS